MAGKQASDLNCKVTGRSDGATLLLVHPMGADNSFWDECLPFWTDSFRCISVDLRGAGASPKADAPLTIEQQAADLEVLCGDIGVEALVPVGCAVGSLVAAAYAKRNSERCLALILSNPGFITLPQARTALQARMDAVRAGGVAASLPNAIEGAFVTGPDDLRRQRYTERFRAQDPVSYAFQIEGMLHADISEGLERITCPTLIVGGGRDRLLPVADHAEKIRQRLTDVEYSVFETGAHFIPYQQPQEFALLARDFLKRRLEGEA